MKTVQVLRGATTVLRPLEPDDRLERKRHGSPALFSAGFGVFRDDVTYDDAPLAW